MKSVTIDLFDIAQNNGFDLTKSEIIEIDLLKLNEPKHLYFKLAKKEDILFPTCMFGVNLKYDVQEIDAKGNPHGNAYKDSYKINKKVEIKFSDYLRNDGAIRVDNFEYKFFFVF